MSKQKRLLNMRLLRPVILYGMILLALAIAALLVREPEENIVFGSMEGRFNSGITMEHDGRTMHYRENEITNYLLIGVDGEATEAREGIQADFLILLSVDRRNRTITPVMIDRDTMTPVNVYGPFGNAAGERRMQICLAQAYRSKDSDNSANTARAVAGLMCGIRINRCLTMDIGGISLLNDAVGGVTVTIEDDLTALDPLLRKGDTVLLQGDLAEHFVRGRMTVTDGTNASRMTRQRTYIDALIHKMRQQLDSGKTSMADILNVLSGRMWTDTHENVLLSEANAYGNYEWMPMRTLTGEHVRGEDGFVEFHADDAALKALVAEIWFV